MKITPSRSGRRCWAYILLGAAPWVAYAQSHAWSQWGQIWAAAFAQWSVNSLTSVPSPGAYTLQIDTANPPAIAGGPQFQPLAVNAPLLIDPGANQEVATPSAVHCTWSPGSCTITLTLAKAHLAPFSLQSATAGLQEAINYASVAGGTVELGPGWSGATAMIRAAAGYPDVAIVDRRDAQLARYGWDGSSYAAQWLVGPTSAFASALSSRSDNGVLNVAAFAGADCGARERSALASIGYSGFGALAIPPTCGDAPFASFWSPQTAIGAGQYLFDPNGGLEEATTGGTTGAMPPTAWPATIGATTTDGSVTWTLADANITNTAISSAMTGTSAAPITNHTFYTPNLGITLWDDSPANNVNALTGQNWSQQISPPDGAMAPIIKVVANETGPSDPTPIYGEILNNDPTGGDASVAGAFSNFGSATDEHYGLWGINEVVGIRNPSYSPTVIGNEVNFDNITGVDSGGPIESTGKPFWGFAASGYGNASGNSAYLVDNTYTQNMWHVGLYVMYALDAAVLCGQHHTAAFPGLCVDAMPNADASYSGGKYYNEPSIPERDNADVMTSATADALSYVERQLIPANGLSPRTCWSYGFNGSPQTTPYQKLCSDGSTWNAGWLENGSNAEGRVPGADIGNGGFAMSWNQQGAGETDWIENTHGTATQYFDFATQASSGGALTKLGGWDPSGFYSNPAVRWGGGPPIASSSEVALISSLPLAGSVAGATTPLAPQSCGDTVTLALAAATLGMVAVASSPAAFPAAATALTVRAAVTATGTVTVGYCNAAATTVTPAAATVQVRVIP